MALDTEIYSYVSRELQSPFLIAAGRFAAGLELGDQLASFCILFILAGYLWQKPRLVRTFTGGLFALAAGGIVVQALKHLIGRARPARQLGDFYFIGPHFLPPGFDAFPSGHTTVICAVAATLWVLWPRGRPLYALAVAVVVIGLIGADYHWLSDIAAGGALGTAVGVAAAKIGRAA